MSPLCLTPFQFWYGIGIGRSKWSYCYSRPSVHFFSFIYDYITDKITLVILSPYLHCTMPSPSYASISSVITMGRFPNIHIFYHLLPMPRTCLPRHSSTHLDHDSLLVPISRALTHISFSIVRAFLLRLGLCTLSFTI